MEDILSNVFVFIPIAIFVALQMASAKKKKAAAEERGKFAQTMKGYAESPKRQEVDSSDDEFDAHSLIPDEDEAPAPRKAAPVAGYRAAFDHAPMESFESSPGTFSSYSAPEAMQVGASEPKTPDARVYVPAATSAPKERAPFTERIEKLPPLKKAVIYAELLGEPKWR
ncbi:MAG: hypothetical protein WCT14_17135 [Treponemataceae bacterium]